MARAPMSEEQIRAQIELSERRLHYYLKRNWLRNACEEVERLHGLVYHLSEASMEKKP